MSERRHYRPSAYQLPFDYGARPLDLGQHVRVVHEPVMVRQPADAAFYLLNQVFVPFDQFKQEQLYVLLLDNKNQITHDVMVYKGTVNAVQVRVAELFMEAVKVNAPSIILSHCHPSGAIDPSSEDVRVTELVYEAGQLLDIKTLDHILVGRNQWLSLRERGLGFP
jgi:DNA repair protein RadC